MLYLLMPLCVASENLANVVLGNNGLNLRFMTSQISRSASFKKATCGVLCIGVKIMDDSKTDVFTSLGFEYAQRAIPGFQDKLIWFLYEDMFEVHPTIPFWTVMDPHRFDKRNREIWKHNEKISGLSRGAIFRQGLSLESTLEEFLNGPKKPEHDLPEPFMLFGK